MKDLKYLCAYTIPLMAFIGQSQLEIYTYLTPIYSFVAIPLLELVTPSSTENLAPETKISQEKKRLFDWMLYLNLPIVYGLLFFTFYTLTTHSLETYEIIGILISNGIVFGSNGINVGHELGHRFGKERFLGKALLLPALYMHFFIEHNYGHHQYVATKKDPATAKYNQPVYSFWITSSIGQYINAWKTQSFLLKQQNLSFLSFKNDMLWYQFITITYVSLVAYFFGSIGLLVAFFSAVSGFLLLETVNYIEHYGLLRLPTSNNRYERVKEKHSWNSNHTLGRIILYELTRHSDHHHRASKKYQILEHQEQSPQLPFGYPTSVALALIPPLWFKIMNKRVPREMIDLAKK